MDWIELFLKGLVEKSILKLNHKIVLVTLLHQRASRVILTYIHHRVFRCDTHSEVELDLISLT